MRIMKPLFAFGVAADLVIVLCCVVYWRFESGDRAYDFLFARSYVQYVTLFVFALILTLLAYRIIRHVRARKEVQNIKGGKDWKEMPASPFTECIAELRETVACHGSTPALSRAEHFVQKNQKDLQRGYDNINFLVYSLPALGLFGTMLGLSNALFKSFSNGHLGPESIPGFISSLGTALDTTVLALVCALVTGPLVWFLNRTEKEFQEQRLETLYQAAGLKRNATRSTCDPQPDSGQYPNMISMDEMRAELLASSAQNTQTVSEIALKLDTSVNRLEDLVRNSLEHIYQDEDASNQNTDQTTVIQTINSSLDQAMQRIMDLMTTHNQETTRTIAGALNRFAEAMEASNVVDTVRAEVRASMSGEMSEISAKLQDVMIEYVKKLECESKTQFDQNGLVEAITTCLEKGLERIEQHATDQNVKNLQSISATIKTNQTHFMQAVMAYMASNEEEMTHVA